MVLLSLGRLFLLLSACALLLAYARPTFRDRLDAIKANHHHSVAHTHPADKHTKAHVSKDQGKLETGSDSAENDDDAASSDNDEGATNSDNDDGATSSGDESNGANAPTGAGGGPNIRSAAEFAPKLIAYVKSKNLKFVTVSECLGVDAYKSTPIQL
ncbi:hypothetical protein [Absidia glauca]|uniref:Uncharacterized protein n=1 Tax=Absidia glauca TaxID=4829 RepID=A0A168PSC6_ABSGL|nr:hypothetical protein [Absidia glauca]